MGINWPCSPTCGGRPGEKIRSLTWPADRSIAINSASVASAPRLEVASSVPEIFALPGAAIQFPHGGRIADLGRRSTVLGRRPGSSPRLPDWPYSSENCLQLLRRTSSTTTFVTLCESERRFPDTPPERGAGALSISPEKGHGSAEHEPAHPLTPFESRSKAAKTRSAPSQERFWFLPAVLSSGQNSRLRAAPWPGRSRGYFFFLVPKVVSTGAPMLASIALASSACGPFGCSSKYLLKASAVPGGATILSPCRVAPPIRFVAFQ